MLSDCNDEVAYKFITIERVGNGYLITVPPIEEGPSTKVYKSTLNGVMNVLKEIWGVDFIKIPKEEIIDESTSEILKRYTKKKNTAGKKKK